MPPLPEPPMMRRSFWPSLYAAMTVVHGLCDTSIAPLTRDCRLGGGPSNCVRTTFSPSFLNSPLICARSRCWMHPAGRWPTRSVVAPAAVDTEPQAARMVAIDPLATMPKPVAQQAPRNLRRVMSEARMRTMPPPWLDALPQQLRTSVPPLHPHPDDKGGVSSKLIGKTPPLVWCRSGYRSSGCRRMRSHRVGAGDR